MELNPISVLLVDDNPRFLRVAAAFLAERPVVSVVGTATGGREGLARAEELRPRVVLMDLAMPDIMGLEVIPSLRARVPEAAVVVLSMLDAYPYRQAALAAGAHGFVSKASMDVDLVPAILSAARAQVLP